MITCGDCQHVHVGPCSSWGCRCQAPAPVGLDAAGDAEVMAALRPVAVPVAFAGNTHHYGRIWISGSLEISASARAFLLAEVSPPHFVAALLGGRADPIPRHRPGPSKLARINWTGGRDGRFVGTIAGDLRMSTTAVNWIRRHVQPADLAAALVGGAS